MIIQVFPALHDESQIVARMKKKGLFNASFCVSIRAQEELEPFRLGLTMMLENDELTTVINRQNKTQKVQLWL